MAYVPALRFSALTRIYDPFVRVTAREQELKRRAVALAGPQRGDRVLDLGCGTGTLAAALLGAAPGASVVGVDGDPEILALARRRAPAAEFLDGLAQEIPLPDASIDIAVTTLVLHHLDHAGRMAAFAELLRVLRPGGRLVIGDWGRPQDPLMALAVLSVRTLDGFAITADNVAGRLPGMLAAAGFAGVAVCDRMRTPLGTVEFVAARAPEAPA